MENNCIRLLYVGVLEGEVISFEEKRNKEGLPFRNSSEVLHFPGGILRLYTALLPEMEKKACFQGKFGRRKGSYWQSKSYSVKGKTWKQEHAAKVIDRTIHHFLQSTDQGKYLLSPDLPGEMKEKFIPFMELLAVMIQANKPFDNVVITLSAKKGEEQLVDLITLLKPYLPRIRQVAYTGKTNEIIDLFEEYLQEEYGIILTHLSKIPSKTLWLDLRTLNELQYDYGLIYSGNKHVNAAQVLKFLDTRAKNGYNTKVN